MATLILFSNCKKSSTDQPPPKTSLKITVSDDLGNKVSGASVAIYETLADLQDDLHRIGSSVTNVNGEVTFTDLKAIKYYWFAEKGCKNNAFGSAVTVNSITANITNTTTTVLSGTGELKFINTSANPYRVYINGQVYTEMSGGSTKTANYAAIGTYTIRVLQISGYVITPTDKTYTGILSCGGVLTTTFP